MFVYGIGDLNLDLNVGLITVNSKYHLEIRKGGNVFQFGGMNGDVESEGLEGLSFSIEPYVNIHILKRRSTFSSCGTIFDILRSSIFK